MIDKNYNNTTTESDFLKDDLGLYVHVPFCQRKCKYCAFLSFPESTYLSKTQYIEAIVKEIKMYGEQLKNTHLLDTVFLGGGTPSLLSLDEIGSITEAIFDSYKMYDSKLSEFTIETNPNSLTLEMIKNYKNMGINRISMGVQSFNDDILKTLGRLHSSAEAMEKYNLIRKEDYDVNIDLMFGVPGQTMKQWEADIKTAIDLDPDHISFYSLQLEEGTPFYEEYRQNIIDLPNDDLERAMYHYASSKFKNAGYEHYEISNCAKKWHECKHNLKYWELGDYLGVGPGASSYVKGSRFKNVDDLSQWYNYIEEGQLPCDFNTYKIESKKEKMAIYCFTALRKKQGIDLLFFEEYFNMNFFRAYSKKADLIMSYCKEGLMILSDDHLALTEKGIDKSNDIMCEFV